MREVQDDSMTDISLEDLPEAKRRNILTAARDLREKGYAVVPNVISEEKRLGYVAKMWDTLEAMSKHSAQPFYRGADYSEVRSTCMPPHKHGICETYRMNHAQVVREIRKDRDVWEVFAALFGSTQLVGSLDRINFKFPGKEYKSLAPWAHIGIP